MTLTYEKLKNFADELHDRIQRNTISDLLLTREIKIKFGLSNYIVENIKRNLDSMNLLKKVNDNAWVFDIEKHNLDMRNV